MDSLDTSHAQAVYHRALDLLAREGIDLNNISMNESGEDSDAESWDSGVSHTAPRELHFVDGQTDSEAEEAAYPRFDHPIATSDILESNEASDHAADLSVAELDRTDEPGSRVTSEGGRRTAAPAAPVPSAISAPLPRLVLPLHIHALPPLLLCQFLLLLSLLPLPLLVRLRSI
jgi:hypothetical protein